LSKSTALTGNTTSKTGTLAFNFRRTLSGTAEFIGGANNQHNWRVDASDNLLLDFRGVSTNGALQVSTSSILTFTDTSWHKVQIAWDMANSSNRACIIDGTNYDAAFVNYTDEALDHTMDTWTIGANSVAGIKFTGDMSDFYFNQSERVDLVANNPFIDSLGKPESLGSDGAIPTGTSPLICLNKGFATWQNNSGTGGNFTENGTITEAATSPSD